MRNAYGSLGGYTPRVPAPGPSAVLLLGAAPVLSTPQGRPIPQPFSVGVRSTYTPVKGVSMVVAQRIPVGSMQGGRFMFTPTPRRYNGSVEAA